MTARLLVAGIGNIFLGDDAFGVEVVRALAGRPASDDVRLIDFGIRGFDLASALVDGYEGAILVDTTQRGEAPGTLYVIEPELPEVGAGPGPVQMHALHPVEVLRLARELGEPCRWVRAVGCEPLTFGSEEEPVMGLSEPVRQAVSEAVRLIESLVGNYLDSRGGQAETES